MKVSARISAAWLLLTAAGVHSDDYLDILPVFWKTLYPRGGETLYCGVAFAPHDRRVNVEHVFPMAWVGRELGCGKRSRCRRTSARFNRIESDMHNLYPALKAVNKLRAAHAYAMIPGETSAWPGCDFELHKGKVEPRPEVRGDIARAMLYMNQRYDLTLYARQRRLLQKWHWQDPPDQQERRRNARIGRVQGNRNRFIDDPGQVPRL